MLVAAGSRTRWRGASLVAMLLAALATLGMPPAKAAGTASSWPPGCTGVTRYVEPGEALDILVPCFQVDGDARDLELSIVTPAAQGTVSVVDFAHVRFVANGDAAVSDSFTVRAADPNGLMSDPVTITIEFLANRVPVCPSVAIVSTVTPYPGNVQPGGTGFSFNESCSDPDGDFLSAITIVTPPSHGTLTAQVSPPSSYLHAGLLSLVYTASNAASGIDSFSYTVTDERGGTSAPAIGTITIGNTAPLAYNDGFAGRVLAGDTRTLSIRTCVDADRDVLTATIQSPPLNGSVSSVPAEEPRFVYTANPGASGPDSFTFRCDDGHGGVSNVATITVEVTTTNTAPICGSNSIPQPVKPGESINFGEPCFDFEHDESTLTLSLVEAPVKGTVEQFPGGFRYTADADASGDDSFVITATDPLGAVSAPGTRRVTISTSECSVTTTLTLRHSMQVWYGSAFQGPTKVRDGLQLTDFISGGVRSHILHEPPDQRVLDGLTHYPWVNPINLTNIEWILDAPQTLPAEANLRAELGAGLHAPSFDVTSQGLRSYLLDSFLEDASCASGETREFQFYADVSFFELNAHESNNAPTCSNTSGNVNAGGSVDVAPSCSDPDSDPLAYAIAGQGTKGTASVVGGQLRYVAHTGTSGTDTFTYTADDGWGGASAPADVTITITGSSGCQLGSQGCTAGYWKTNAQKYGANAWPSGLTPGTQIGDVFTVPTCVGSSLGNATFLQALGFSGGKTVSLAAQGLLKQSVGGLLNASNSCIQYGACQADLVARTNAALA
jgi:hypothetical protein